MLIKTNNITANITKKIWLCLPFILVGCGHSRHGIQDGLPKQVPDIRHVQNATPQSLPRSRYGNPSSYTAMGKRYYVLKHAKGYQKVGIASWYGTKFHGRLTSSREPYDMFAMTAASPELPIPTFVRVTNLENHKEIIVKVNDRGPFAPNRIIDLSYIAAKKLGIIKHGTARVQVSAIDPLHPTLTNNPSSTIASIYLQLGSFQQLSNAEQLKNQLMALFKQPVHVETEKNEQQQSIYRVIIGPIKNMLASNHLTKKIQSLGYHGEIELRRQ